MPPIEWVGKVQSLVNQIDQRGGSWIGDIAKELGARSRCRPGV